MKEEYIIVLQKHTTTDTFDKIIKKYGMWLEIKNYDNLSCHFKVSFDIKYKSDVKKESCVIHVCESNAPVSLMTTQNISVDANGKGDNWGLSRIGKRDTWKDYDVWYPNSGTYVYFKTGSGVDTYIIDTGARLTHHDLVGHIDVIYDHYRKKNDPQYGVDQHGHGTHVASTVAGKKYGVAKNAHILISRVFEKGSGTLSAVISGINACLSHHNNKRNTRINRPSIINMSLGGPAQKIEEQAINACIDAGIICVAAAGNAGKNLAEPGYDVMPAEVVRAITVGSVDIQDYVSSFSNYGSMVDVFAPGHYISAAGFDSDTGEKMLSGTSMAAPHVTGVCALFLEGSNITTSALDVAKVHNWIRDNATPNTVHLSEAVLSAGTANRLLFSDFITSNKLITETSRTSKDAITTNTVTGTPIVKSIFTDNTTNTINANGSITTITTRHYTITSTEPITITTTTITTITILYSNNTTKTIINKPVIVTAKDTHVNITYKDDIINKVIKPKIKNSTIPVSKTKNLGWWKSNRAWQARRNTRYYINTLDKLEILYNKIQVNSIIENKLAELELSAEKLSYLRRHEKVVAFASFTKLRTEVIKLIWTNRRNKK